MRYIDLETARTYSISGSPLKDRFFRGWYPWAFQLTLALRTTAIPRQEKL
jgi:hypothetical protein